jgi:zinc carboxypeptidase
VTRRLIVAPPPVRAHLWIVNYLNPDGAATGSSVNAHGVDLNRNFPWHWQPVGIRGDLKYSGPRPKSEPETRIAMHLIERIRPTVTIWFHQPVDIVRVRTKRFGRTPVRQAQRSATSTAPVAIGKRHQPAETTASATAPPSS